MNLVSTVLRALSEFGDAAGWLIAAGVLFLYGRRIVHDNDRAHAAITENVRQLDTNIDGVETKLEAKIDAVDVKIDKVETKLETKIDKVDVKIDKVETKLETKIDKVETKLEGKIDARFDALGAQIDGLAKDVAFIVGRLSEPDAR